MYLLVPVDFSPQSEVALRVACRLAGGMGAVPLVLHVVHAPADMPGYYSKAMLKKPLLGRVEDIAAEMLGSFLARAAQRQREIGGCAGIESLIVRGRPTTRIVEVARQHGVKLIIMCSQGRTGFKHLMMGSVAEQVVRLAPMPVTVVKS